MEYVSIGAANPSETLRGSATRGSATGGCGVGAVGGVGRGMFGARGSGAMIFSGAGAIIVAGAGNGRSGGDSQEGCERRGRGT